MCNKFSIWMDENDKTQQQVAEELGVTQGSVSRWCAGESVPRPEFMQKITIYTGGEVTANDFYGVKELSEQ